MKGVLSFNLPQEREEFELAQRGGKAESILSDILNHLRNLRKYEDKDVVKIEELEALIHEELDSSGIPS